MLTIRYQNEDEDGEVDVKAGPTTKVVLGVVGTTTEDEDDDEISW